MPCCVTNCAASSASLCVSLSSSPRLSLSSRIAHILLVPPKSHGHCITPLVPSPMPQSPIGARSHSILHLWHASMGPIHTTKTSPLTTHTPIGKPGC